jgi:Ras family protein A
MHNRPLRSTQQDADSKQEQYADSST